MPLLVAEVGGAGGEGKSDCIAFIFSRNYAANSQPWEQVLRHRGVFLSRQASAQFRGFAEAQLRRLKGIGAGKKGQRHELIGAHGYDIKAAMHVIRLLNEGIELMRSGHDHTAAS
jgi:hypothetical protein